MKLFFFLPIYYIVTCFTIPFITTLFIPNEPSVADAPHEDTITVFNHTDRTTYTMNTTDYITGVVAAEMPAAFGEEALKAQAVAARTYALYKAASVDHPADVCTDHNHCQAFFTETEMRTNWGSDYDFYYEKINSAVYSTQGEILTYNEEPIMAVFHSMGGGQTESCADVWGTEVPYLVSVPSPGEETASNYRSTVIVTFEDFKNTILAQYPNATVSSYLDVSAPALTQGGHVKSIIIGSVTVTGSAMRTMFDLRSTKFDISFADNNVIFSVTGYGHGVGMSQYGANAMAQGGKTYKEILSHYYPGTTLTE